MKEPEELSSIDGDNLDCKLKKSINGLKQAFFQLYLKFHKSLHVIMLRTLLINAYTIMLVEAKSSFWFFI